MMEGKLPVKERGSGRATCGVEQRKLFPKLYYKFGKKKE